jgi:hypothetical protein
MEKEKENEVKKFKEYYEDVIEGEENNFKYKTSWESLNNYRAWVEYLGVTFLFYADRRENETLILDEEGRIMKAVIRKREEDDEKWSVICKWDRGERVRDNRAHAENIALAKLFNCVIREAYIIDLRFREGVWKDDGKRLVKKMRFGDYLYLEKKAGGYKAGCFITSEKEEGEEAGDEIAAGYKALRIFIKKSLEKKKIYCAEEKDYRMWAEKIKDMYRTN